MERLLRVLIIEDSEEDTVLLLRELQRVGYDVEFERVETGGAMGAMLSEKEWDLILSDYSLPKFSAPQALETLKISGLDIPFIIISGTVGEEIAVVALKAGANDFLVKGKFVRLGPAIERELREAESRRNRKQAEEQIKYHARLLKHINDAIIATDDQFRITAWNRAAERIYGWTVAEVMGRNIDEVLKSGLNDEEQTEAKELLKESSSFRSERIHSRRNGKPVYVEENTIALTDKDGNITGYVSVNRDITERKQAEGQVKYQAHLLSNVNDVIIATDESYRITFWNRAAESLYGWSTEEVLGKFGPDITKTEFPGADADEMRRHIRENGSWRGEVIQAKKDGTRFPCEISSLLFRDEKGNLMGYVSINHDITERKRVEEQINLQVHRLRALHTIDVAISSSFNLSVTLDILLAQVTSQLNVDASSILLFQPITRTLVYASGRGFRSIGIRESSFRLGQGYAGKAILERRIIHIPNLKDADNELVPAFLLKEEEFIEYYCVPLVVKGEAKGVLEIFHRSALAGDSEWLDFLETLAGQAAIAIENTALFENLQRSHSELLGAYDATIEGWSHALDLRDKETEGHTLRVTDLTIDLARKVGLPEEDLLYVRWGALLHDIGKMGIPDNILLKPDPLTEAEWEIMKKHPIFAFEMLSPISYLKYSLDIPYCHHEKWDGTGYPRGLNGEEIPLAARLFAVVDVWDALRSDRPYRKSWSAEKTIEYIRSQAGSHFDPKAVEYFLELMEQ